MRPHSSAYKALKQSTTYVRIQSPDTAYLLKPVTAGYLQSP
jgi:hypothetical protein